MAVDVQVETACTWEPTAPSAFRMTLRNRGTPTGSASPTAPVVERAMRRATTKDLARLKSILEASCGEV